MVKRQEVKIKPKGYLRNGPLDWSKNLGKTPTHLGIVRKSSFGLAKIKVRIHLKGIYVPSSYQH